MIYDDKHKDVVVSGKKLIVPATIKESELVFKASFYIVGDVYCDGKIIALFDLTVLGNIYAEELDVKGSLVCTGKCNVKTMISVQNGIWVEDLVTDHLICHDNCMAQGLNATDVRVDGNIIIGKAFGIEGSAQCDQKIICGETVYGAGRVAADMVILGEPIDLDGGSDALFSPNTYTATDREKYRSAVEENRQTGSKKYCRTIG